MTPGPAVAHLLSTNHLAPQPSTPSSEPMSDEIVRSVVVAFCFAVYFAASPSASGAWCGRSERYITVVFIVNGFLQFLLDLVCSYLLIASVNKNVGVYELNL